MASIFTFDPDPPRVASPWSLPLQDSRKRTRKPFDAPRLSAEAAAETFRQLGGRTSLEAEPQSGPTEYKLHLLLRPRKSLSYSSTPRHAPLARYIRSTPSTPSNDFENPIGSSVSLPQAGVYKQHRLEQLTTQLLWRLQQSSPYHSTAPNNLILPTLPHVDSALKPSPNPGKLLSGLEDSRGALYEIGVADDGTFVGLTEDEMSESLNNLRAMAYSLGCSVEILRKVVVGQCEWIDDDQDRNHVSGQPRIHAEELYVTEAYVKPALTSEHDDLNQDSTHSQEASTETTADMIIAATKTSVSIAQLKDQLRVSLTGATTCGKSSILGTLSTSTLDNGRGKSRLSLLKHRHEIVSGMTSSVAQELIGYHDVNSTASDDVDTQVINYATGNVSSWDDIHVSSEPGRLSFLLDSAGHPRYRRTTVRGLMGWAPHWTILCIAANDGSDSLTQDGRTTPDAEILLDIPGASAHISMAHLDLCLRLDKPMVVVITKMDVASKSSIRQVLSAILTSLKAAGRRPTLLPNDNHPVMEEDLQKISMHDSAEALKVCTTIGEGGETVVVPILFTSSVKGTGIGKLHALLRHLPIPTTSSQHDTAVDGPLVAPHDNVLFHVNDSFTLGVPSTTPRVEGQFTEETGNIISGRLERGLIAIGDVLWLGPFSSDAATDPEDLDQEQGRALSEAFLSPRSFSDAVARAMKAPKLRAATSVHEWRRVRVISIRNLRLPVRQLHVDQVGTIGVISFDNSHHSSPISIRKGMVLAKDKPEASHSFTARFDISDASSAVVGSMVIVYCGSTRASAKVIAVSLNGDDSAAEMDVKDGSGGTSDDGFGFEFEENPTNVGVDPRNESILVTIQFLRHREFWGVGSQVLVMPSAGHGIAGLEGFVGTVVETFT